MPRLLIAALAASVLIIAGCGGSDTLSKPDYQKKFNAATAKFTTRAKALKNPDDHAPASERAVAGEKAADVIGDLVDDLDALHPPEEVAQAHKDLTAAFRESSDLTKQAAKKLRAGDEKGLKKVADKLRAESATQKQAAKAIQTLKARGYKLDLNFAL
jgi:hypothetical protein